MATKKKREKTTKVMSARGRPDTIQDTVRDPSAAMVGGAGAGAGAEDGDSPDDTFDASKSLTREIAAVDVEALLERSRTRTASVPMVVAAAPVAPVAPVAPPPPPTMKMLVDESDLAQTIEAPAIAPRVLILDAGDALIAKHGYADLSEEAIAKAASCSIDVFHAHFADKTALLRALNLRFCEESIALTNEATKSGIWDRAAPRDVIEVAVRSILDVVLSRAALVRAVLSSGDLAMLDAFRRVGANITAQINRVLNETQVPADQKPTPKDVGFAFLLAVGLAHHAIMVGTEWSGLEFDREELYERAAHAAAAYLESRLKTRH
jgi:AcrR family transcriptional regulator